MNAANGRPRANPLGAVLVTGSAGFIGSHLVEHLARGGRSVIGLDRRPTLRPPDSNGQIRHIQDDLGRADLVPILDSVSCVVHLAADSGVRPSWDRFEDYVRANLVATQRILEACLRAGVPHLVIASSSSVYGNSGTGAMGENQAPAPVSPYAVTKLAAEQLALAYSARQDSALTTTALRLFTVYGPRQRPDMLIARLMSAALTGSEVCLYGDGSQRRDFVYVGDVVRALDAAVHTTAPSGVINVGTGRTVSVSEVIATVGDLVGRRPAVRLGSVATGDVALTCADVRLAEVLLGFRSEVTLHEGLARHIDDVRASLAGVASR